MVEASEAEVEPLIAPRFDELKLLVNYIDRLIFGGYRMIGGVGVDVGCNKHVLGIREGATENSMLVAKLLVDVVARGIDANRKMLFVVNGSKALRVAIHAVLGPAAGTTLPRTSCATYLTICSGSRGQVKSIPWAAWKLDAAASWRAFATGRIAGPELPVRIVIGCELWIIERQGVRLRAPAFFEITGPRGFDAVLRARFPQRLEQIPCRETPERRGRGHSSRTIEAACTPGRYEIHSA